MRLFNTFIAAMFLMPTAYATDIVFALSPHQSSTTAEKHSKTVLKAFCAQPPSSNVIVLDGYSLKTIATLKTPNNPAYKSCKTRIKLNRQGVSALMRFGKATRLNQNPVNQAVLIPQLLYHTAQLYAASPIDVIVLGSPLYHDPRSIAYSFADGLIPSDGHFKYGRSETPFGIDDQSAFKNIHLHIGYDSETIFMTDQHRNLVQRFWSLYLSQQGGQLMRFTSDKPALFNSLNAPASPQPYKLEASDKLEMIRLRQNEPTETIYDRPLSNAALPAHNISTATNVELGITWDCPTCDIDLYARPTPQAETLFFGKNKTAQGMHLKDFTTAPDRQNGFETIIFNDVIDLNALDVVINFYSGTAKQDVHGILRLAADGQVYAHRFILKAGSGNGGDGVEQALTSDASLNKQVIVIDPVDVVSNITQE